MQEPLIVQNIDKVLQDHNHIMIVYGSAHYEKQAAVYEQAFGKPQIQCLKP